jgi:hypothetical protein
VDLLVLEIRRFIDDAFPGFVECLLVDAEGCAHGFVEKAPVVSSATLSRESVFPQAAHIACVVQEEWTDERGRKLVRVATVEPWGMKSLEGKISFTLFREQLKRG